MLQPSGMERVETEEELPAVFTFNLALSHSATYYRWREVGQAEQLVSDEDIACFLLQCYEKGKRERQSDRGVCSRCQSPLTMLCMNCDTGMTQSANSILPPYKGYSQTHNSQTDYTSTHSKDYTHVMADLQPSPLCAPPGHQLASPFGDQSAVKQETEEQGTVLLSHRHGANAASVNQPHTQHNLSHQDSRTVSSQQTHTQHLTSLQDSGAGLSSTQDDSDSESADETPPPSQAPPLFPSPSQPPGRGRPRVYPAVNLKCEVCGRKLSSRQALFSHMTSRHPSSQLPPSLAHLAAKQGVSKTVKTRAVGRRGRKKKVKEDVSESDCEEGKDAEEGESKTAVKEKLQRRKAELESLKCETCGMKFDSKRQMYTHRRLCQWKVCHVCGKSVKQLEMHLKRHSAPRRFPCPHCPKTFLFRNYLEGHLLYHTGQRPFCCEICGARYREKTRLNAHLRTHTGVKPFKCTQCDAAFTRPRGLHDHMRVHTGEKPYACQVCGRQFSSSGNLAAHRRKVHKLQPQVPNRLTRKLFVEPGLEPPCEDMGGV